MSLSKDEIKYLLQKAQLYKKTEGDDLPCLKQALDCYDRLIGSEHPHAYYFKERADVKSRLYLRLVDMDLLTGAIADIGEAIRLDPDNGENYFSRGAYLLDKIDAEQGFSDRMRLKAVIAEYKSGLSRLPTNFTAWRYLIAVNIIYGDYDEAISLYGQCKPYSDHKESALFRAYLGCLALILTGDEPEEEDIRPLYDSSAGLLKYDPCEGYVATFLGRLCSQECYRVKCDKLMSIMNLLIGHYQRWFHRAFLLEKMGLYREALQACGEAVKQEPVYYLNWYNQSRLWEYFGENRQALEACEEAIRLKEDFAPAWTNKGNLLHQSGRYQDALQCAVKAVALGGGSAAWNNQGTALLALARYEEALKAFEKAIALNPGLIEAWKNKGLAFTRLDDPQEALSCFEKAIEINAEDAYAWNDIGFTLYHLDRYGEALRAFDKALELDPDLGLALENKRRLKKILDQN